MLQNNRTILVVGLEIRFPVNSDIKPYVGLKDCQWGAIQLVEMTQTIYLVQFKWADRVLFQWSKGQNWNKLKHFFLNLRENMSLQKWMKVDHMMAAGLFSLVILGLVVPRKLFHRWKLITPDSHVVLPLEPKGGHDFTGQGTLVSKHWSPIIV